MSNTYTVYMHVFPNEKVYVGITQQDVLSRWNYGRGYDRQPRMKNAISKYGWENIDHKILADNVSKAEAEDLEIKFIADYRANEREYGYNLSLGGNHSGNMSTETRQKMSESRNGCVLSEETRNKISLSWTWRVVSDDTRKKLSLALKGLKRSDETKRKISEAKLGKPNPLPDSMKRMVVQIDIETSNIMRIYTSITEASRQTGVSSSDICECINGKALQAKGYLWISKDKYDAGIDVADLANKAKYNKRFHKVYVINLQNGTTTYIFNSIALAAENYGVSKETIKRIIKQNRQVFYCNEPVILKNAAQYLSDK